MTNLTCIGCPLGCRLEVDENNDYAVTGNLCNKGAEYGKNELKNPLRVLTTTVSIEGAMHGRCPVRTESAIPKEKLFDAMKVLSKIKIQAPVKCGQVVLHDILGTGVNVIATRDL